MRRHRQGGQRATRPTPWPCGVGAGGAGRAPPRATGGAARYRAPCSASSTDELDAVVERLQLVVGDADPCGAGPQLGLVDLGEAVDDLVPLGVGGQLRPVEVEEVPGPAGVDAVVAEQVDAAVGAAELVAHVEALRPPRPPGANRRWAGRRPGGGRRRRPARGGRPLRLLPRPPMSSSARPGPDALVDTRHHGEAWVEGERDGALVCFDDETGEPHPLVIGIFGPDLSRSWVVRPTRRRCARRWPGRPRGRGRGGRAADPGGPGDPAFVARPAPGYDGEPVPTALVAGGSSPP